MSLALSAQYRCIKDATLSDGVAGKCGFILADEHDVVNGSVTYSFSAPYGPPFAFVFGFRGVGCHYQCHINPSKSYLALYEMRDGIRIYLHHIRINLPPRATIAIVWDAHSLRLRVNNYTLMQALAFGPKSGRWGFAPLGKAFTLPKVTVAEGPPTQFDWVCVGDGFSNARWMQRDFLSWPEIVFGESDKCLNACLGACNSKRASEIIDGLLPGLCGKSLILTVGADDLYEGEDLNVFLNRTQLMLDRLAQKNPKSVCLSTLCPRSSALFETQRWSNSIRELASRNCIQLLDFHEWLKPNLSQLMVAGEYPGKAAQFVIAGKVARVLGIPSFTKPPNTLDSRRSLTQPRSRLFRRIQWHLRQWLEDPF